MQIVTFFFHAHRESDPSSSMKLAEKHFPGAFRQGHSHAHIIQRGLLIRCTGEQFVAWIVERCNMGFVNRIKQLEPRIEYRNNNITSRSNPPKEYVATPIQYATPEAEGLR